MTNQDITKVLEQARQTKFYGHLTFSFRKGEVTTLRREETLVFDRYFGRNPHIERNASS